LCSGRSVIAVTNVAADLGVGLCILVTAGHFNASHRRNVYGYFHKHRFRQRGINLWVVIDHKTFIEVGNAIVDRLILLCLLNGFHEYAAVIHRADICPGFRNGSCVLFLLVDGFRARVAFRNGNRVRLCGGCRFTAAAF